MSLAIEVENLEKSFKGGVRALDGVSFSVEEGSIFGLLGPNGAGKTTIVRILTTILQPDAGHARVLGHDVKGEAELVRTLFGLAGQYTAVDENLTGMENLKMVSRLNGLSRADSASRATALLDDFQLSEAGNRVLKTYSGGMRRRLDVAAALVVRPRVLFLDEPTTGLDPQSRLDLWGVIEDLVRQGTTVLLTTQYLEEADRLAQRVAVVDHGRLISEGTPMELKASLGATVLELGLIEESEAIRARDALSSIDARGVHLLGTTVEMTLDGGPIQIMEALRVLDQHSINPQKFQVREPSLDDVFLSLTGHQATAADDADPAAAPGRGRRQQKGAGR